MIPAQLRCLYLHGFKSSPCSAKAQQTQAYFARFDRSQDLHIPQLANDPRQAIDDAQFLYEQLIDEVGLANVLVIGSSLGGYYAHYLIERFGGKAVLINPAVAPYDQLEQHLGENEHYHTGEKFMVTPDFMESLKHMEPASIKQPMHYRVMLQTADESLDYQLAVNYYQACQLLIEHGGNHSFTHFEQKLAGIMHFAQGQY